MVYVIKDAKNIYLWQGAEPTEEYVMLSDWGSVNKYSELTLYWTACLNNQTTYWQWYCNQTDKRWIYYKQFDKKIVGFKIVWAPTNNSYDSFAFSMSSSVNFTSGNIPWFVNSLSFDANSNWYNTSGTWWVFCGETVSWSGSNYFQQSKNNSTTRVTFEWTLENGVWHTDITTAAWQSWSTDRTPNAANTDLYVVWFRAGRRYTWQAGNFYEVVITLQW